jgi:integrase
MKNTFTMLFGVNKRKVRKDGTAPVQCRVTIKGQRTEFSLNHRISPSEWKEFESKNKHRKASLIELSDIIFNWEKKLKRHYQEIIESGQNPTVSLLRVKVLGLDKDKTLMEITSIFYKYKESRVGQNYSKESLSKLRTSYRFLQEFIYKKYKTKDININEVNKQFLVELESYFITEKGNSNNTMANHIKKIRSAVNFAWHNDIITKHIFKGYRLKVVHSERTYLEKHELTLLENKKFELERLQAVKDLFLFCCYTGLSYIDLKTLSKEHILSHIDARNWISMKREKTDVKFEVPALSAAQALIIKYKDHPLVEGTNKIFPVISNQRLNSYLKEIGDLSGIKKSLHFKASRHTFGTTICADNQVPIETTAKMMGHKRLSSTAIYYKISRTRISADMNDLENKMNQQNKNNDNENAFIAS